MDNNDRNNNDQNNSNEPRFNFNNNRFALFFLIALIVVFVILFILNDNRTVSEVPYSSFLNHLENQNIQEVKIYDQYEIQFRIRSSNGGENVFRTFIPYHDDELMTRLIEENVQITGALKSVSPLGVFIEFIPWIIGFLFIWFMFRQIQGGGNKAFSFGKSKAKKYLDSGKKITFSDVAGQHEAKYELQEVVEFLENPQKFVKMGARIPTGVLLVGMPGTGKTLLAKAVAGEAGVSFFHMSGSDFVEMFVGVGASRVRDLFEQGRKNAPCILFIDELDAVGRTRGAGYGGGHDEREQTLNQMLVEMDGFDTKDGVIILAATNRPDVLDPALLRPGRFDRQVVVDMPDVKEREAILRLHCKKVPVSKNVDLQRLGRATPGTSGADLANLVNEAALFAARKDKPKVDMDDFEEARDKLLMGVARKSRVISANEKMATAYHEAGHALLHYYLDNADPLHKVSVIPRGRALGVAISLPEKDSYSKGRGWILDRIRIAYGGFAAEKITYDETTTGAKNDIEQATDLARKMVCEWGMSDTLGPVAYGKEEEPIFLGKEIAQHKEYSEKTAQEIDDEIRVILKKAVDDVMKILTDHEDQLKILAEELVKSETLDDSDIRKLLGFNKKEDVADIETDETSDNKTDSEEA
jgi:cell division protease FtsH